MKFRYLLLIFTLYHLLGYYLYGLTGLMLFALCYLILCSIGYENPLLFQKRNRYNNDVLNKVIDDNKILKIAHRSGSFERLENSMDAF